MSLPCLLLSFNRGGNFDSHDTLTSWDLHVTSSAHHIKIYSVNKTRLATAERLQWLEAKGIPFEPLTRPIEVGLESDENFLARTRAFPREPRS